MSIMIGTSKIQMRSARIRRPRYLVGRYDIAQTIPLRGLKKEAAPLSGAAANTREMKTLLHLEHQDIGRIRTVGYVHLDRSREYLLDVLCAERSLRREITR